MKIQQTIPSGQIDVIIKGLQALDDAVKLLDPKRENQELWHLEHDIRTLSALLKSSEIIAILSKKDYDNFTANNGVDFPMYDNNPPKVADEVKVKLAQPIPQSTQSVDQLSWSVKGQGATEYLVAYRHMPASRSYSVVRVVASESTRKEDIIEMAKEDVAFCRHKLNKEPIEFNTFRVVAKRAISADDAPAPAMLGSGQAARDYWKSVESFQIGIRPWDTKEIEAVTGVRI